MVNRLKIPQGFSTLLFHRWSEVPSRGEFCGDSPYEKLPALQRCHLSQSLAMWFHWCYCFLFSVLFSIALLLLSLHVLPFMVFFFEVFFMVVMFFFKGTFLPWLLLFLAVSLASSAQFFLLFLWPLLPNSSCCFFGLFCPILLAVSLASSAQFFLLFLWPLLPNSSCCFFGLFCPILLAVSLASSAQFFLLFLWPLLPNSSCCFFGLFCPILLGGCLLAHRRASISSDWFFIWHSLRPSSTQLLVNNHSGFCSHWYLVGLLFLLSTSFYRLCFSLPPCFSFKWFSSL